MKLRRISSFGSALLLSLSSLLIINVQTAFAATATWDGEGSDDNFSTATNWVGDVVPSNGDDIILNDTSITGGDINNDLVGASFVSLEFEDALTLTGNAFTIDGAIDVGATPAAIEADLTLGSVVTVVGNGQLRIGVLDGTNVLAMGANALIMTGDAVGINSEVTGSGSLIFNNGSGSNSLTGDNGTYTGAIDIVDGTVSIFDEGALGTVAGNTTVQDGARLVMVLDDNPSGYTIAEPFSLGGDGDVSFKNALALNTDSIVTLSGAITLTANTVVVPHQELRLTGALSGSFTIAVEQGKYGNLVVQSSPNTSQTPNGTYDAPDFAQTLSDSQPGSSLSVGNNETITVTGTRDDVSVGLGGVLKGTGTVDSLVVNSGGHIAPGMSPGCLNSGNLTLNSGSTYDYEVGGATVCTEYDQIKVTGSVTLAGTLNLIRYNNFVPVAGQSYMIIENDASDAVSGTFNGLAEGATFTVDGHVFKISYVGGTGNDVVVTPQVVAAAPNTGFALILSNPLVSFFTTLLAAGAIFLIARTKYAALKR